MIPNSPALILILNLSPPLPSIRGSIGEGCDVLPVTRSRFFLNFLGKEAANARKKMTRANTVSIRRATCDALHA